MLLATSSPPIVRFSVFEVDLRVCELRKQGVRVKLQDQPFQVLTLLLKQPGEVVSREELRSQLWGSDTFIDFDNGLNTSINKLREALGDSADSPRFIETLPRRGYRFIAPLESRQQPGETAPSRGSRSKWLVIASFACIGALAIAAYSYFHRVPKLTDKDTIVLADFTNSTGDTVFDNTLRQGLSVQLEQSPFLSIVSDYQIQQTLPFQSVSDASKPSLSPIHPYSIFQNEMAALYTDYRTVTEKRHDSVSRYY